jgi:hypothetical protein
MIHCIEPSSRLSIHALLIHCVIVVCHPESIRDNQKRQPKRKQPLSGTGFQLSFYTTVVKISGTLMR